MTSPTAQAATSLFVLDNIPGEMSYASPLWNDIPQSGELVGHGGRRVTFRVAHDLYNLYLRVTCAEPDPAALRAGRTSAIGVLQLDDCLEAAFVPTWTKPGRWLMRVNVKGEIEWIPPQGATVTPAALVETACEAGEWRLVASIPFVDLFAGLNAAGTPISGDRWGFNVGRISPDGGGAGRWVAGGDAEGPSAMGELEFFGGPTKRRVKLDGWTAPNFGDNTVKFDCQTSVREGAVTSMDPPPAERKKTRTKAHMRFRVARPGPYRLWVDVAEEPPPASETPEDEEPSEQAEPVELPRGESACRYGVTFLLRDVWEDLERMESHVESLRAGVESVGGKLTPEMEAAMSFFDGTLVRVERFRAPNVRECLSDALWGQLISLYERCVTMLRGELVKTGALRVESPYSDGGEWLKAALHVGASGADAAAAVAKLREAGYKVVALAQSFAGGRFGDIPAGAAGGDVLLLSAVEAGEHVRFLSVGVPLGGLAPGEYSYAIIRRTREAGGASFLLAGARDIHPLPPELAGVSGIEGNVRLWDRYVAEGSRMTLIQGGGAEALGGPRERFDVILAKDASREAVLAALAKGSFYASTGPLISGIQVSGLTVTVRSAQSAHITFVGRGGQVLSGAMGTEASFTFTGAEGYVRASVLVDVDADGWRREAVTQPFYLREGLPAASGPAARDSGAEPETAGGSTDRVPIVGAVKVVGGFEEDDGEEEPGAEPAQGTAGEGGQAPQGPSGAPSA